MKTYIWVMIALFVIIIPTAGALPTGTVLYIPGNSTAQDWSGYPNLHTILADPTLPTISNVIYKFGGGSAYYTPGANIAGDVSTNWTDIAFGPGDWSVSAWVNQTGNAPTEDGTIVDFRPAGTGSGQYPFLGIQYSTNKPLYTINGGVRILANQSISKNVWHYILLTHASNVTSLYVDGVFNGSYAESSSILVGTSRPKIGNNGGYGGTTIRGFPGYIDEFIIVKEATLPSTYVPTVEWAAYSPVGAPVASFATNATSGYSVSDIQFSDTSTNTPTSWEWNFTEIGNGTSVTFSTLQNPTHSFPTGNYSINLTATNAYGTDTSDNLWINISAIGTAQFNDLTNPSSTDEEITVYDITNGTITAWDWGWGDGTVNGTTRNATHTYTTYGTYQVFLNVSNSYGFNSTVGYHTVVNASGFNQQDLVMDPQFVLRINIVDSKTNQPIPAVLVFDSYENNQTTTTGVFTGTYGYGVIVLYFSSEGYISKAQTFIMDEHRSETVQLDPIPPTPTVPASVRYTPHLVRFIAKDYSGQPVQDVAVFAQGYETTTSDNWIYAILGLDMNTVPMTNATLSGTTGSDGSIVFLMLESVQYSVNFTSQSKGISQSLELYPKEDSYLVMLGTTGAGSYDSNFGKGSANVTRTLWANQSGTRVTFNFTYRDPTSSTTSVFFYVEDESHKPIYNSTYVGSVRNFSYVLDPLDHGKTYYYGYLAQSSTFGRMYENRLITTHSRLLAPLEYLGWDTSWYMWITVVCLIFFVALFSGTTSIYGTLLFPFWSLFFGYIGWLDWCPFEFLVAVAVLGTAAFISKMYSRVGDG